MKLMAIPVEEDSEELYHHGIKGMHWGVRLYQNKDGSLTDLGRMRYGYKLKKEMKKIEKASKLSAKKVQKEKQKAEKKEKLKARLAEVETSSKEEAEKQRQREVDDIIRSGDKKRIYKNRHKLTDQELDRALKRINTEDTIRSKAYAKEDAKAARKQAARDSARQRKLQAKTAKKGRKAILSGVGIEETIKRAEKATNTLILGINTIQAIKGVANFVSGSDTFKNTKALSKVGSGQIK